MSTKLGRGRNDRCPCGSGKKYKKCCLAKDEQAWWEQAEFNARWYPRASDLQLLDVPENLRPELRERLAPVVLLFNLGAQEIDIAIGAGRCWNAGQCLQVFYDKIFVDHKLKYVEGCWTRSRDNDWWSPDDFKPAPHAWNSFEGYTVDLIAEFYGSSRKDAKWVHELLREYSTQDLDSYYNKGNPNHWVCVSSGLWLDNNRSTLPEAIRNNIEGEIESPERQHAFDFVNGIVFKDASERLLARLNATTAIAA